ncbi:alpha/beta fold hydrolase [Pseudomonas aeruginosa]
MLLLGGAFQSFRSFTGEVSELLAPSTRVILLDLPSQGGNLQLAAELSLEDLADLIAAFAEQLGLPPLMPIGLSYGPALAALFAARHPRRCCACPGRHHRIRPPRCAVLLREEAPGPARRGRPERLRPRRTDRPDQPATAGTYRRLPVFRKAMLRQLQRLTAAGDRTLTGRMAGACWPSAASSGTRPARPWCSPASTTISPSPGNMRCSPMPAGTPSSP